MLDEDLLLDDELDACMGPREEFEKKEIHKACSRIQNATEKPDPEDYKLFLLQAAHANTSIKKLCIHLIFKFNCKFPDQRVETINCLLELMSDEDVYIRKMVAGRISVICKEGFYVDQITEELAELFCIAGPIEYDPVWKSLSNIMTDQPKKAVLALYKTLSTEPDVDKQLKLLKFLDDQVEKVGELGETMRLNVMRVYITMLDSRNSDLDTVLSIVEQAIPSGHFKSLQEKVDLINAINFHWSSLSNNPVVRGEQLYKALSVSQQCAEFINLPSPLAERAVQHLMDNIQFFDKFKPDDRRVCLKVAAELTSRRIEFRFIRKDMVIKGYLKLFQYFASTLPTLPEEGMPHPAETRFLQEVDVFEMEALLMILHNLMPVMKNDHPVRKNMEGWKDRCRFVLSLIKDNTRKWVSQLDGECTEEVRTNKEKCLRVSNNIGVLLIDFLQKYPVRNYHVTPSWDVNDRIPSRLYPSFASRSQSKSATVNEKPNLKRLIEAKNIQAQKRIRIEF